MFVKVKSVFLTIPTKTISDKFELLKLQEVIVKRFLWYTDTIGSYLKGHFVFVIKLSPIWHFDYDFSYLSFLLTSATLSTVCLTYCEKKCIRVFTFRLLFKLKSDNTILVYLIDWNLLICISDKLQQLNYMVLTLPSLSFFLNTPM